MPEHTTQQAALAAAVLAAGAVAVKTYVAAAAAAARAGTAAAAVPVVSPCILPAMAACAGRLHSIAYAAHTHHTDGKPAHVLVGPKCGCQACGLSNAAVLSPAAGLSPTAAAAVH